jgi:phenylalanyl-tRNA synthetase beta chain
MKVTYNWLKDFVEIKISARQLAEKLTMAGLEVTSLEERDGDAVLDIEVTSNRPDCLSVIGIAREVAAITNSKMKSSCVVPCLPAGRRRASCAKNAQRTTHNAQRIIIKIEDKKDCPLYTAKIIRGVKVGPSPDWLKKRLELIGCRSVNNIVDITNYILFTWGEPLHAFDLDKLVLEFSSSRVLELEIRRARKTERITTIDGISRGLDENILIIAAGEQEPANTRTREHANTPIAIAGIMGGKDTEVGPKTREVLLEAAIFDPVVIRRAGRKLGLSSESSYRFERGVDVDTAQIAAWQAVGMIQELAGGECVLAKAAGVTQYKESKVTLNISRANKILGTAINPAAIKRILSNLGFRVRAKSKQILSVAVPAQRQDVRLEADLIEEIARIWGYARIPQGLPACRPSTTVYSRRDLISGIKNILVGLGLNEVITYSLIDRDSLGGFGVKDEDLVEILNPLSKEQEVLRPLLMPSLARSVAYNLQQKQPYVNIFEIAHTYLAPHQEQDVLGIALCGARTVWYGPEEGHVNDEVGFLHLKGILETLFRRLGRRDYRFVADKSGYLVEVCLEGEKIGVLRKLEKKTLERLEIKHKEVFLAEVGLTRLLEAARLEKKFKNFSRLPGLTRDVTLELQEDIALEEIMRAITACQEALLEEVKFAAYFKGEKVAPGYKRLTLSFRYASGQRTLTETEVSPVHERIIQGLKERFQAKIC